MTALRSETWVNKDLNRDLNKDPHMQAAMHLSKELREAHISRQFLKRQLLKRQLLEKNASQPLNKPQANMPKSRELDLFSVVERKRTKSDKHTGHVICEHLLASLRKQVAEQSCLDSCNNSQDVKDIYRLATMQNLASGNLKTKVEQAQEQLSLI